MPFDLLEGKPASFATRDLGADLFADGWDDDHGFGYALRIFLAGWQAPRLRIFHRRVSFLATHPPPVPRIDAHCENSSLAATHLSRIGFVKGAPSGDESAAIGIAFAL